MNPILTFFVICIILLVGYFFVVALFFINQKVEHVDEIRRALHELRLELIKEETRRFLREHRA